MSGWSKLFGSIVTSSIWCEPDHVLRVWIAFLATCNSSGEVEGSIPGMARLCGLTVERFEDAVSVLSSPDRYSRTPDNEGRRIVDVPGGWKILNYGLFRERGQAKEGSRAAYLREWRRLKAEAEAKARAEAEPPTEQQGVSSVSRYSESVSGVSRSIEAEAEAETEAEAQQSRGSSNHAEKEGRCGSSSVEKEKLPASPDSTAATAPATAGTRSRGIEKRTASRPTPREKGRSSSLGQPRKRTGHPRSKSLPAQEPRRLDEILGGSEIVRRAKLVADGTLPGDGT